MNPATPMIICSSILAALGLAHLLLTFIGPRLLPRDPQVQREMERTHLVLTKQTTVWRAWIGFNASHSVGAMLFGVVYGYLAWAHSQLLFQSVPLLAIGFATLVIYWTLAKAYWFVTPLVGISLALASYVWSMALVWG